MEENVILYLQQQWSSQEPDNAWTLGHALFEQLPELAR